MSILILAVIAFNPLFTDHAVLQRDRDLTVWGTGAVPGERLTLTLGAATTWTKANFDGTFRFILPPQKAGGPFELTASGVQSGTVRATDILIGEVWVCGGQSNMQFLMKDAVPSWGDKTDMNLRCFTTSHQYGFGPCAENRGDWRCATPDNVRAFTAVGTFFGEKLRRELNVPVGLLFASLGGTRVEAWTSRSGLAATAAGRKALARSTATVNDPASWKPYEDIGSKSWPKDPGPSAAALGWTQPEDPSDGWRPMAVPSQFSEIDGHRFNGAVWYRRDVTLPAEMKGKDLVLTIPAADKHDRTYVDGTFVGATGSGFDLTVYNKKRVYRVPAALTADGKVRIAIRVWSHVYGGGIGGYGEDFTLASADAAQPSRLCVAGTWQTRIERDVGKTVDVPRPIVPGNAHLPHCLYDSEILPLIPYAIRGAIWYQGESNEGNAGEYRELLGGMVRDWRYQWGQGDFPFIAVQLAAYHIVKPFLENDPWAEIRQAILDLTYELPNFGVASALDVGAVTDIHPKDKLTVGERLAAWALHHTYGLKGVVPTGPRPCSCEKEGTDLIVRFTECGEELVGALDGTVRCVYVAGKDGKFREAATKVDERDTIRINVEEIDGPQEVRYAWSDNPGKLDLYNSAKLPASPFRIRVGEKIPAARP